MPEQQFETSKNPKVTITGCGSAAVRGWIGSSIKVKGDAFDASMPAADELQLRSAGDLDVTVPSGTVLLVEACSGRLEIKHVEGHVVLMEIGGPLQLHNLKAVKIHTVREPLNGENIDGPLTIVTARKAVTLRSVGPLQLDQADGDVEISYVKGPAALTAVLGSASLDTVSGDLAVGSVGGDAAFANLGGSSQAASVGGSLHLSGGLRDGNHSFKAAGEIIVRWPTDAPLSLTASGGKVLSTLNLNSLTESTADGITTLTGYIEHFKCRLMVASDARIGIKGVSGQDRGPVPAAAYDFDFEPPPPPAEEPPGSEPLSFSDQLSQAITSRLEAAGTPADPAVVQAVVAKALADLMAEEPAADEEAAEEEAAAPLTTASVAAAEKAVRTAEQSLQRAADKTDEVRRKAEGSPPTAPAPEAEGAAPSPEPPAVPPDPTEETMATDAQLNILKLLRDGHLTIEQAKTLLDAEKKQPL